MSFEKLFRDPPAQFRGAPFWSWNGKLEKEVLKEQIDVFHKMGFGGFHIHSRIGLATPYLGEEFMDCVKFCNEYGKSLGMTTWLYDEDKWPSGFGGGFVTKNEDFRARYLLLSPKVYAEAYTERTTPTKGRLTANGVPHLLARYDITLQEGKLEQYRRRSEGETGENLWYAYEVIGAELPWFNNGAYVDVLHKDATKKFLSEVHERYKKVLGEEFGKSVPAIFTDEPQFTRLQPMADAVIPSEGSIPYSKDMDADFKCTYGYSLIEKLPEVFWEKADGILSQVKYQCHDYLASRYAENYCAVIGKWCEEHGILFSGHLMNEHLMEEQSMFIGEAMRSYPYFHLPGIDMLAGFLEYDTAKQAQSVARQEGKCGVISELYGVTNWDYDFAGHKVQGDWQAALGVTVRVPHLSWMSMGGESKRDYPAPIDSHSPWYEKYKIIEDHFARLNTVLRRGRPIVNVAVLHPIESHWMLMGPDRQCMEQRLASDERLTDLIDWLLFGLHDFDLLSEALLPKQKTKAENGCLQVGEMTYQVVVVPQLVTIRETTVKLLEAFEACGGTVIYLGELPTYCDGLPAVFPEPKHRIGFTKQEVLKALEPWREVDLCDSDDVRPGFYLHQLRQEGDTRYLFVCHGKPENYFEASSFLVDSQYMVEFSVKGEYGVELMDTFTGDITPISSAVKDGKTYFSLPSHEHDSFLFRLSPARFDVPQEEEKREIAWGYLPSVNKYRLEEPNVLLLDRAKWQLDGGLWHEEEEILKIDDEVRRILGMRLRTDSAPQPWVTGPTEPEHWVALRFNIRAHGLKAVDLAFEGDPIIRFNSMQIPWEKGGYFVDRAIHRIRLGTVGFGDNELILYYPFGESTSLEWCYLLGDFGVSVMGREARLTPRPKRLGFGSYHTQGFPFYGGNMIYETETELPAGEVWLEAPMYNAPVLGVRLDGGEERYIFKAPHRVCLGRVEKGDHQITLIAYGSRINQFGQVHNCNPAERYFGPKTWRTTGRKWCYEYRLKDVGILTAPIIRVYG